MTLSKLVDPLDQLASALRRLDYADVESCSSQLEELAARLKYGQCSGNPIPESARAQGLKEVRDKLLFCVALNHNAARFYSGWARLASLQGAAYTPTGDESNMPGTTSLVLRG
jgi:hypothetical protein